jgi:predicted dehydrogenase
MKRRQFLATCAAAAAIVSDRSPNSKLGVGFIGTGNQAGGLLGGFLGQDTRVLAVCDVDSDRRNAAKKRVDEHYQNTGCAACTDFRDLPADATPKP